MNTPRPHALCAALSAAALAVAAFFSVPFPAAAQQTQSRLTPLVAHPSGTSVGPSLRLSGERVGLSTITAEDSSLRVGSELLQGESVVTLRSRPSPAVSDAVLQRRQQAIRQDEEYRHKRTTVLFAD